MSIELSIVIPVYNAEKYLNRCIDSIINQSYKKYEIILINDGSTDSSLEICKQYSETYENIFYYNILNSGPSRARNYGLKKSRGQYLYFIDSDDYISIGTLETLIINAKKNNADMVICNYRAVYMNGESHIFEHEFNKKYSNNKEIVYGIIPYFYKNSAIGLASLWNKIYRKEIIVRNKINFDEKIYRGEDWWFNLHFLEKSSIIITVDDCLYNYWQGNQNSIMKRLDENYYSEWKKSREYLEKLIALYNFDIDRDDWCTQILYNIHALLIKLSKEEKGIDNIVNDKFYNNIINYDKKTNNLLKLIHLIHKISIPLEKYIYKLLSKKY